MRNIISGSGEETLVRTSISPTVAYEGDMLRDAFVDLYIYESDWVEECRDVRRLCAKCGKVWLGLGDLMP